MMIYSYSFNHLHLCIIIFKKERKKTLFTDGGPVVFIMALTKERL